MAPVLSLLPRGTRYPKEIGRAFRKASLKLHPDKLVACGVEETSAAEEAFAAVREAYDTLSDPVARDRYDKRASRVCPCFLEIFFFFCYIYWMLKICRFYGPKNSQCHQKRAFLCAVRFHVEVLEAQTRHINNLKSYRLTQQWSDKLAFWKLALIESYRFVFELVGWRVELRQDGCPVILTKSGLQFPRPLSMTPGQHFPRAATADALMRRAPWHDEILVRDEILRWDVMSSLSFTDDKTHCSSCFLFASLRKCHAVAAVPSVALLRAAV